MAKRVPFLDTSTFREAYAKRLRDRILSKLENDRRKYLDHENWQAESNPESSTAKSYLK